MRLLVQEKSASISRLRLKRKSSKGYGRIEGHVDNQPESIVHEELKKAFSFDVKQYGFSQLYPQLWDIQDKDNMIQMR